MPDTSAVESLLDIVSLLGVGVFAVSGALAAGRKRLDLMGVLVIALVTAVGGGTLRDLLLDRHPIFWIRETENLLVTGIAALFTLVFVRFRSPPERLLLIADGVGLAVFSISGTQLAVTAGLSGATAVIMGVITGVVGGMLRDVLTGEIPLVLRRGHLYATAAIVGSALFLLLDFAGVPRPLPTLAGIAAVAVVRFASIVWGLHLPVFTLPAPPED